ncbi:MAG: isocitrate lyase/phosphoenolpyruvate mutase family protein [Pseudomonadota bacterium]
MSLRSLLDGPHALAAPGAYDAFSARIIAEAGFPLAYLSGLANEASDLGYPDIGFTTASELVRRAGNLARVLDVPLVCDADTGFGGPANVIRTVREFEAAGVSAIHLEDQVFPKRCGVLDGKEVVAMDTFARTVQTATDARESDEFLIIARTDAKQTDGVDGVIQRLCSYVEAGADAVMTGDFYTAAEYAEITRSVSVPLFACAADPAHFDVQPNFSLTQWQSLGVKVAVYWYLPLFAASAAVRGAVNGLRDLGTATLGGTPVDSYHDYAAIVDLCHWLDTTDR